MQQLKHQASQQLSTLIHRLIILLLSYVLIWPVAASAEGVARLKKFYDEIHTVKADFYQVVTDKQGKKIQEVYGQMQLKRPNKFRWNYSKPFEQQIMSDGKKIWLYDTELAQVSVQDLSKALGSSPAGLLSGDDGLEKNFQLLNVASKDGLDWVRASPKDADAGFNKISL